MKKMHLLLITFVLVCIGLGSYFVYKSKTVQSVNKFGPIPIKNYGNILNNPNPSQKQAMGIFIKLLSDGVNDEKGDLLAYKGEFPYSPDGKPSFYYTFIADYPESAIVYDLDGDGQVEIVGFSTYFGGNGNWNAFLLRFEQGKWKVDTNTMIPEVMTFQDGLLDKSSPDQPAFGMVDQKRRAILMNCQKNTILYGYLYKYPLEPPPDLEYAHVCAIVLENGKLRDLFSKTDSITIQQLRSLHRPTENMIFEPEAMEAIKEEARKYFVPFKDVNGDKALDIPSVKDKNRKLVVEWYQIVEGNRLNLIKEEPYEQK
jgi:hypothetical protein